MAILDVSYNVSPFGKFISAIIQSFIWWRGLGVPHSKLFTSALQILLQSTSIKSPTMDTYLLAMVRGSRLWLGGALDVSHLTYTPLDNVTWME